MEDLLHPLRCMRKAVEIVQNKSHVFDAAFVFRRALSAHARYAAITVACPWGTLWSDKAHRINAAALWYDEDNDQIRELARPGGLTSAPRLTDLDKTTLTRILELTSRCWREDTAPYGHNEVMDYLASLDLDKFHKVKVKPGLWVNRPGGKLVSPDTQRKYQFNLATLVVWVSLLVGKQIEVVRSRWKRLDSIPQHDPSHESHVGPAMAVHFVLRGVEVGTFHVYLAFASVANL